MAGHYSRPAMQDRHANELRARLLQLLRTVDDLAKAVTVAHPDEDVTEKIAAVRTKLRVLEGQIGPTAPTHDS